MCMTEDSLHGASGRDVRRACRNERLTGPTAGLARGYVQANLFILPETSADAFAAFCRANPRPCPIIETTTPGSVEAAQSAPGSDVRTDAPRYRVFHAGVCVDQPTNICDYWPDAEPATSDGARKRFVAFLLGCSFTFETALRHAGLPVRHIDEHRNVPMYRTNIACTPAGPFHGPLVVSMRPMTPANAQRAVEITLAFPNAHGPPIHIGDPDAIGIAAIDRPDYGDAVTILPGEVPVFWACGVTPIEAIIRAKLPLAITHEPGHMFVTDQRINV